MIYKNFKGKSLSMLGLGCMRLPGDGRFLYSAFSTFNNEDLRDLLLQRGVETKVERGG